MILVLGLSVLSGRLVKIQLVDRKLYAEKSSKAFFRREKLPPTRGLIMDRNEQTLARSIPVASLVVDKKHLEDPKLASYCLAWLEASSEPGWLDLSEAKQRRRIHSLRGDILASVPAAVILAEHLDHAINVLAHPMGLRRAEMRERITTSTGKWVPIVKDIPEDQADVLRDLVDRNWLQGFNFENSAKRFYLSPNLATHLIGFTGELEEIDEQGDKHYSMVGKFGVECAMEKYLAGREGWREHRRDQHGLVVPGNSESLLPPRAGFNVKLTIDMGLQSIVEEELDANLAEFESTRGAVVLLDPKTGDLLAMASRPHFDLNRKNDLDKASYNFAIQAIYEPGSTFKLVAASGVLNEGVATPDSTVFCHHGLYQSGKVRVPDHHGYGTLSLEGVLAKSSNIGAYMFALKLGNKRFYDYVERFGFGRRTGILLSGESRGITTNTGNAVDFSRASFGYALNVTPLQMACAYGAIANGGKLFKPHVVRALTASDRTLVQGYPPELVCQVVSPRTAKQMLAAMEKVVEKGGTATAAAVPGFRVAGKTGTARRVAPNGRGYLPNSYTVSFVGMMPAQDPAFVCVVVIDDPKTTKVTRYGGTIAAPAFAKIAARLADRMNLQPTEPLPETPLAATTQR